WYYVVGEVKNPHGFVVKFPEIVATFYNATHDVVRVEVAFSQLETLQPEEVSPFEIILVDPPDDLQHYVLQTEAVPE
ncbi:MAG TPA: FxLYD domain-containing protein, partial [Anaerolineae bacterium]|nr:FxLYD domain-containing protein [Anaerolineae bacterium]